ncbi:MAG: DUF368 domain-containing protein [Anaerovoracaceae bacterium]
MNETNPISLKLKIIYGTIIGGSMLIPGVSGGTTAILLGIYDDLISTVSGFRKSIKKNGLSLIQYSIGGILGMLLLSRVMLHLISNWELPIMFFFIGAIIGSLPPLYSKAKLPKLKLPNVIACLFGTLISLSLFYLPANIFKLSYDFTLINLLLLLAIGVILAIALVLPGISASYVLLMLGLYKETLYSIKTFNLAVLVPLGLGTLLGIFLVTNILEHFMSKHPQFTYMVIIGFMFGSIVQVFPGVPSGITIVYCLLTGILGLVLIFWLSRKRQMS